jgi:hypothetical protein
VTDKFRADCLEFVNLSNRSLTSYNVTAGPGKLLRLSIKYHQTAQLRRLRRALRPLFFGIVFELFFCWPERFHRNIAMSCSMLSAFLKELGANPHEAGNETRSGSRGLRTTSANLTKRRSSAPNQLRIGGFQRKGAVSEQKVTEILRD